MAVSYLALVLGTDREEEDRIIDFEQAYSDTKRRSVFDPVSRKRRVCSSHAMEIKNLLFLGTNMQ
jgi:hypothetical protein